MHLCKRTHLYGVIGDECRLNKLSLTKFTKDFVNKLSFAHCVVNLKFEFLAHLSNFVFGLTIEVVTCFFFNCFENG